MQNIHIYTRCFLPAKCSYMWNDLPYSLTLEHLDRLDGAVNRFVALLCSVSFIFFRSTGACGVVNAICKKKIFADIFLIIIIIIIMIIIIIIIIELPFLSFRSRVSSTKLMQHRVETFVSLIISVFFE